MVGHGESNAGTYLADPTSPIPSHCASVVMTSTVRVNVKCSTYSECFVCSVYLKIPLLMVCLVLIMKGSPEELKKTCLLWALLNLICSVHLSSYISGQKDCPSACKCKSASHDNWCSVGGDGGCRVGEVLAGTTSPMPDHKGFKLQ